MDQLCFQNVNGNFHNLDSMSANNIGHLEILLWPKYGMAIHLGSHVLQKTKTVTLCIRMVHLRKKMVTFNTFVGNDGIKTRWTSLSCLGNEINTLKIRFHVSHQLEQGGNLCALLQDDFG